MVDQEKMNTPKLFRCLAPMIAVAFLISSSDMRADSPISAAELQKSIRQVIGKSAPAVVGLTPTKSGGAGSGVIVSEDGLILTAAHVINAGSGDEMTVWLTDGRQATAKKLGSQTGRDAAMLQIQGGGKWPFADVSKGNPGEGDWVVAMGHPGGFQPERTPPVRLGRILRASADSSDRGFLVSDSAVSGGDSGGPLFDLEGRVVGIHSSIGMSLEENRHVPITAYTDGWDRLVKGESWGGRMFAGGGPREGAALGVQLIAGGAGGDGAVVEGVVDGSPAAKAGIQIGDVIVKFSGQVIGDAAALVNAVGGKKPGDKVVVSVRRGSEEREIEVELGDASKLSAFGQEEWEGTFRMIQEGGVGDAGKAAAAEKKPAFGVRISDLEGGGDGAEVVEVLPGSVAAKAGIKEGDVVVGFGGKGIGNAEALVEAVQSHDGGEIPVKLMREGNELRVKAKFPQVGSEETNPERSEEGGRREGEGADDRGRPGRGEMAPRAKGFFFDGEELRELDPEELREMMRKGGFPGWPGMRKPELGVEIEDGDIAAVAAVVPGTVAERTGIRKGDEITELAGKKVTNFESLVEAVQGMPGSKDAIVKVRRDGKTVDLPLASPDRPKFGPPGVGRFGFQMKDGKLVPMEPEALEKMLPGLRGRTAPGGGGEDRRPERGAEKAQLGLMIDPDGEGVVVGQVAEGSAAEKAGLKAGDRVLEFGGSKVGSFEDLAAAVEARKPGEKVKMKVRRDGKERSIEVELGRAPEEGSAEAAPGRRQLDPGEAREMMERMRRGEIRPEDFERMFGGNLELRRGPQVDPNLKRANGETLKGFQPATAKVQGSVVKVKDGSKQVAMGTVVDGVRILTKASQIAGKKSLQVELPDGKMTGAKVSQVIEKYDLALLEVEESNGLKAVRFVDTSESATVGTLVTSPDPAGRPTGFGVISVAARSLSEEDKGFLGIQIGEASEAGVEIAQAFVGGAAEEAGLRPGDVVVKAAGVEVTSPTGLIRQVAGKRPGEEVVIEYVRNGKEGEVKVKLRSRADMGAGVDERMNQTARMGTRLSEQRSGYPSALTHDMPVDPEDCGSPLINLEGEVIGINIARAGRTNTYALPGEVVRELLAGE